MDKSLSIDLAQKSFDPTIKGEWVGFVENKDIFLELYMMKKYKEHLFYIPFISLISQYTDKSRKDIDFKPMFGLLDNNEFEIHEYKNKGNDIFNKYYKLYKDTNKRFTFFPYTLIMEIKGEKIYHAVFFLHDKNTNEIELFDSNNETYNEGIKQNKKSISNFFKEIYGDDVKIDFTLINRLLKLRDISIGAIYNLHCYDEDYSFSSKGWCSVWALWYLEFRLKNRNIPKKELYAKAFKVFISGNQLICKHTRGYAQFIQKTIKDYKVLIIDGKKKVTREGNNLYRKLIPLISLLSGITVLHLIMNKKIEFI